jgi:uncharacterized glyoxalase superfamily protein PhnB
MKTRTITLTVSADPDAVFAFLSRLENLPLWATATCRDFRRDDGVWKARLPGGEAYVALLADAGTGVIDLLTGDRPDEMALRPLRVIGRPHGSGVIGTLFQLADEPDEVYELNYRAFLADLRGLAARFGGGEVQAPTREGVPFYPGLVTANLYETWDFYTTHLGFRTIAEDDTFVQLAHPTGAQLAILRHELDGPASELVSATDGRGYWLNIDVADADAEHARLCAAGVAIVAPPTDKPWGERMFVVRDPNGVLIALAHWTGARADATASVAESV